MRKSKKIDIKLYQCKVHLFLTDDLTREYNRIYKKHGEVPTEPAEDGEAWTLTFDICDYYILINDKKSSVNTIAHEVYHVVYGIMQDRDIQDEESGAWLCGMLIDEALKFYNKHGVHRQIRKAESDAGGTSRIGSDNTRIHQPDDN